MRLLGGFSCISLFSCIVNSSVLLSAAVDTAPLLPAKPPQPFWHTKEPSGGIGLGGAQRRWDARLTAWYQAPGPCLGLGGFRARAAPHSAQLASARPASHAESPTARSARGKSCRYRSSLKVTSRWRSSQLR